MPLISSSSPVIDRKNHIVNGDFATDVSGWSGATITRVSGKGNNQVSTGPHKAKMVTTSNSNIHQQVTGLTIGKKYIFSYRHFGGYTSAHVGPNTSSASALLSTGDSWAPDPKGVVKSGVFTADATSVYVNIYGIGNNTSYFTDVKLVEDYYHHAGSTTSGTSKVAMSGEYPKIAPTAVHDFSNSRKLDERWYFRRASGGTYYGPNGYVQTVGLHIPRFQHDPDTLECLGLLTESSRTNHVTNNSSSSHVSNAFGGGALHTYTGTNPEGKYNACWYYQCGTASGYAGISINVSGLTNATNRYFCFSIYLKILTGSYNTIVLYDNAQGGGNGYARFNLSTGTMEMESNANTCAIQKCKDGWYRVRVSGLRPTTPTDSSMMVNFYNGSTNSFAADGSSQFAFWGAQYEDENKRWPAMPIKTTGSKVTSAADRHFIYGQDFQDMYDASHTDNHGHGTLMMVTDKNSLGNWANASGSIGVDAVNGNMRSIFHMGHSSQYRDTMANTMANTYILWATTLNAQNAYVGLDGTGQHTFKTAVRWNKNHSGMDWDGQMAAASQHKSHVSAAPDPGSGSTYRGIQTHWQALAMGGNLSWEAPTTTTADGWQDSTVRYLAIWDKESSDDELLSLCSVGSAP